jgi:hypothetical protein
MLLSVSIERHEADMMMAVQTLVALVPLFCINSD